MSLQGKCVHSNDIVQTIHKKKSDISAGIKKQRQLS